jgi:protocatechuate 3,4-dioxygenase beta subunit
MQLHISCSPISKAAVDVWQCDALGIESGYESVPSGALRPAVAATPARRRAVVPR